MKIEKEDLEKEVRRKKIKDLSPDEKRAYWREKNFKRYYESNGRNTILQKSRDKTISKQISRLERLGYTITPPVN